MKAFKKVSLKVKKGHQRSRIAKKGQRGQISNIIRSFSMLEGYW